MKLGFEGECLRNEQRGANDERRGNWNSGWGLKQKNPIFKRQDFIILCNHI